MSELSNFLVESILGESAEMENVIVVYSGRFQPFHKGHFATYKQLISKFGKDSVYIATSNKTDNQKSPFDFREKKTIMTKMFGIPSNKIVQVKNPYKPTEILSSYDAAKTGLISVVGEKDEQRLGGNYFTPYKGKVEMGYLDKGYVYAAPSQSNPISGTDVRNWLSKGTEEEKKEGFLKAYPKFDAIVFKFITLKLAKLSEDINLDVNVGDTLLMGKFKNKRVVVKNIDKDEHGMPTINGKKATTFRIPTNESSLGGYSAEAGEPETGYVADGQKRYINKAKPEPWFKQGGYKQLHIPQGDWIRGKGKDRDKDSTFRKVYYKVTNMETSDLDPAKDPHKVEDWKEVKAKKKIKKPKRFWEDTEMDAKLSLISEEELNQIAEDYMAALDEMGLGGGAGVGLSLPDGYINGAPKADDVAKVSKKLKNKGMSGYEEVDDETILEYSGNGAFYNDGNATTGTMWNSDWDDYNNAEYYLDNLEGWCFYHEDPSEYEKKKAVDQKLPTDDQNDGKTDKYNRILKYNFPKPEDLTEMAEMAKSDLDQVEKYADQQLSPEDIELGKESDHFFQRLNDPRNGKQISAAELTGFFKRLARNKKKFLEFVKQYKEFVVKDNRTKINIPFMTVANKLIAKTIMRKDDFKSSTPVYTTEEIIVEIAAGIYGGKLKINGQVVPIEVELVGVDNKTREFITKIVHIDSKYFSKFPIGSTFKIPARVFTMPGGGWHKVKNKAFEAVTSKNHKPIGTADHNFTQHHKSSSYAPDYGHPAELDTIDFDDDREIEPGHQTNTKDTQKKGYEPVKKVNESKDLLIEGGAYGHMHHPFDIEMNLTFSDLKNIVKKALTGDLDVAREKTDGQALAISWVNGRLVAARNKSHLKNKGEGAMTIGQVADKFAGRGGLTDAYNFAMSDLSKAIGSLSEPQRKKVFNDGSSFMNLEVIYPTSVNVIPYNQPLLVFHGTFDYDIDGNIVGENQQSARILAGMIKQVNASVQSKYTIQGPPMQKLPKSENLTKLQSKYMSMISKLQSEFGLSDSDGVADYHQAWWSNFVDKNAKGLDAQEKIGLVKRWAFGDKGFRIATIQDPKLRSWADNTEKKDQAKIAKDNLMKFEEIFLGVGADVLSFMESVLTANPTEATKQMVARLHKTVDDVRKLGDPKKLDKLKLELQRLQALGGFEKIVPNEGIVFVYNGNTYKLTGAFAPLNQILGLFYE
jgi:hypothetical protein